MDVNPRTYTRVFFDYDADATLDFLPDGRYGFISLRTQHHKWPDDKIPSLTYRLGGDNIKGNLQPKGFPHAFPTRWGNWWERIRALPNCRFLKDSRQFQLKVTDANTDALAELLDEAIEAYFSSKREAQGSTRNFIAQSLARAFYSSCDPKALYFLNEPLSDDELSLLRLDISDPVPLRGGYMVPTQLSDHTLTPGALAAVYQFVRDWEDLPAPGPMNAIRKSLGPEQYEHFLQQARLLDEQPNEVFLKGRALKSKRILFHLGDTPDTAIIKIRKETEGYY